MADSKRANPEYAFDVDIMTIDYVVYKGIEAHIHALGSISSRLPKSLNDSSHDLQDEENATRLVEMFDSLLRLFRLNHGDEKLSERIQFNIKILQFLTLVVLWCKSKRSDFILQDHIPEGMAERLYIEQIINRAYRKTWLWLHRRQHDAPNPDPGQITCDFENPISLGDNLMIRFLELSEEMASVIDSGQLSDKWVKVAEEFMFQSALEKLGSSPIGKHSSIGREGLDKFMEDIREYCAWGYQEHEEYAGNVQTILEVSRQAGLPVNETVRAGIEARAELEDRIEATLFNESCSNDALTTKVRASKEPQKWTVARERFEQELHLTLSSIQEAEEYQRRVPVGILKENHPTEQFLEELKAFIENQWALVSRSDWQGKPILIQIEQGYIDGLSGDEFEAFKQRVGI